MKKKINRLEKKLNQCYQQSSCNDTLIEELNKDIEKLNQEISSLKKLLHAEQKEIRDKNKYIEKCEIIIKGLEEKIEQLKSRIKELTNKNTFNKINSAMEETERRLKECQERHTVNIRQIANLSSQVETLQNEISKQNQQIEFLVREKAEFKEEHDACEKRYREIEAEVNA